MPTQQNNCVARSPDLPFHVVHCNNDEVPHSVAPESLRSRQIRTMAEPPTTPRCPRRGRRDLRGPPPPRTGCSSHLSSNNAATTQRPAPSSGRGRSAPTIGRRPGPRPALTTPAPSDPGVGIVSRAAPPHPSSGERGGPPRSACDTLERAYSARVGGDMFGGAAGSAGNPTATPILCPPDPDLDYEGPCALAGALPPGLRPAAGRVVAP